MTSVSLPDSLSPETPGLSSRQVGLILFALTLGGFAIGTGEFASMGLIHRRPIVAGMDKRRRPRTSCAP